MTLRHWSRRVYLQQDSQDQKAKKGGKFCRSLHFDVLIGARRQAELGEPPTTDTWWLISYLGCIWVRSEKQSYLQKNNWMMEIMDNGLKVPKWVLIVWPKIPPKPPLFGWSALLAQKFRILLKKTSLGVHSPWGELNSAVAVRHWKPLSAQLAQKLRISLKKGFIQRP